MMLRASPVLGTEPKVSVELVGRNLQEHITPFQEKSKPHETGFLNLLINVRYDILLHCIQKAYIYQIGKNSDFLFAFHATRVPWIAAY